LLKDGDIVAALYEDMKKGQAERLFPMLDEVLSEAAVSWKDLDAVAVGTGPGNFTGIRIGVSAARGLALSLDCPAIGVTSFEALECGAPERPLLLAVTAPRESYYLLGKQGAGPAEPTMVHMDDFSDVSSNTVVIGNDSPMLAERLGCQHAPSVFAPASAIARVAATRMDAPVERPTPFYMRPPDAAPASDPPPVILP